MNQYVVKLTNGEDIVCEVNEDTGSQLKISSPLKMDTISRTTTKGVVESLSLARWVQPYSDEQYFNIEKNSIVIMTPASAGLARYYEYVLNNIHNMQLIKKGPSKKELKVIEEEMDLEEELVSSEDLKEILDNFSIKKTIH
jgi:hypothetical protein